MKFDFKSKSKTKESLRHKTVETHILSFPIFFKDNNSSLCPLFLFVQLERNFRLRTAFFWEFYNFCIFFSLKNKFIENKTKKKSLLFQSLFLFRTILLKKKSLLLFFLINKIELYNYQIKFSFRYLNTYIKLFLTFQIKTIVNYLYYNIF